MMLKQSSQRKMSYAEAENVTEANSKMITQTEKIHFTAEVTNTGTFCFRFLSQIGCVCAHTPTRLGTRIPLLEFSEVRERGKERKQR